MARHREDPSRYRLLGSACHDRFCIPCQKDRGRTIAGNALEILQGKPVRFVTLTVRTTTETLAEALTKLDQAFIKLRRRAFWKHHVTGGAAFTEVKWIERTRRWHPHLHVLTHGRFIPQLELKREWRKITGDSDVVDVRLVRDKGKVVQYVVKYCGKGTDTSYHHEPELLDEAVRTMRGRRFLSTFGDFKGHKLCETASDDEWEQIGELWELLQQARDGDTEAEAILTALDEQAAHISIGWLRLRDPPPVLHESGPEWDQAALDFVGPIFWPVTLPVKEPN